MSLYNELQRRNVFRVSVAYVVSAWLLAQVADLVLDNIGAPDWVMQTILLVLVLGLAPVIFFSWAYEVTPEGIKRESEVNRADSITHITRRKLDRTITFVLVLAVAYFAADKFLLSPAQPVTAPAANSEQQAEAPPISNTIAVLPFVNMSDDRQNEFFSDGLSEELLNVLAKNPELQVAARTSSFSLKGEKLEVREIGQRLNVDHILEGSVRKSGDMVRITAQLIRADNGFHLWSDAYDRSLDNIFEVQDEIAAKITAALLPHVVGESGAQVTVSSTQSYEPPADAYQAYLLARDRFNRGGGGDIGSAYEMLQELVRKHPDYAEAQALYAHAAFLNSSRAGTGHLPWIVAEAQVRRALQQASAVKPDMPEIYLVEGLLHARSRDPRTAMGFFERAIELNPSYAEAYRQLAQARMDVGLTEPGWDALETARRLDPLSVSTLSWVFEEASVRGEQQMADEALSVLRQISPVTAADVQMHAYADMGRSAEAAIAAEDFRTNFPDEDPHNNHLAIHYAQLGKIDEAMALSGRVKAVVAAELGQRELALATMEEAAASVTDPHDRADHYWQTYMALGMKDEALEVLADLWYGYAAEDLGPKMDYNDLFTFVQLLRDAGREDEAAPLVEILLESSVASRSDIRHLILMTQGKYEEALEVLTENAANGRPGFMLTHVRDIFFMLHDLPGYAKLEDLVQEWRREQRALYDELSAARESTTDIARP